MTYLNSIYKVHCVLQQNIIIQSFISLTIRQIVLSKSELEEWNTQWFSITWTFAHTRPKKKETYINFARNWVCLYVTISLMQFFGCIHNSLTNIGRFSIIKQFTQSVRDTWNWIQPNQLNIEWFGTLLLTIRNRLTVICRPIQYDVHTNSRLGTQASNLLNFWVRTKKKQ